MSEIFDRSMHRTLQWWFACVHWIAANLQSMDYPTCILEMGASGTRDLYVSSCSVLSTPAHSAVEGVLAYGGAGRIRRLPQGRADANSRRDHVRVHPKVQHRRHPRARGGTRLQSGSADRYHRAQVDPHRRAHSKLLLSPPPESALTRPSPFS